MIFVYITCQNKQEAKKIGEYLVKRRLAGCVNIFPIESMYWWKGKIVKDKEAVLIVKTINKNYSKIEKEVRKLHSYTVPFLGKIEIKKVNQDYLNWLIKETK